ncbi:glycosyl-4,4'-diaponeurosporenoate acyltransferase [Paenibacillus sp. GCM10023252]|uniref:glycosyl-4,4'-diaponeurosporenoate acyltransferase CrtO family protein n=1 Tax=Paenibacillus sp. GCM10023252 TaxID=3252649 RepID=UPI003621A6CF
MLASLGISLSSSGMWLLNGIVWTALHLLSAFIAVRLPARLFERETALTRLRAFEAGGAFYERAFAIHRWKDKLPDGGAWFKQGFAKAHLASRSPAYLQRFVTETRRGEWTHWCMLLPVPLFTLYNDALGLVIMFVYALIANLPCILVQRYNRARLLKVMTRRGKICYAKETSYRTREQ